MRIRNERTGQGTSKDGTAFSPSPFPEKGKNSVSTGKTAEKSRTSSSISAEMTGDSCMARAVVPRTAAAVDHADTELIGHRGWKGTGFLCGEKAASWGAAFFFTIKRTARKHGHRQPM